VKDAARMLKQVQQMQGRMAKVQEELAALRVEAAAGGGAVKAVVSGSQQLVSIRIDPEAAGDAEMLEDLVLAAVNQALEESRRLAAGKMQEVAGGLGLPPGLL